MQVASNPTTPVSAASQAALPVAAATTAAPTSAAPTAAAQAEAIIADSTDDKKGKKAAFKRRPKQIPTFIALIILVASLAAGILLFGNGTGVFAPRATPQTTPKNVIVSNVTDKSFSVSFYTDEETIAFVAYGASAEQLNQQSSDDRDQLSGVVGAYRLHHITVRGLNPGTTYYYKLGTGSNTFDENGQPYQLTTARQPGSSPTNSQTIYGVVNLTEGVAAEGSVVYISNPQMGTLSSLVKESGSWGVSLATAFTADGQSYASLLPEDSLQIRVQGIEPSQRQNFEVLVAEAQPVATITLNQALPDLTTGESSDSAAVVDKEELLAGETEAASEGAEASDAALLAETEAAEEDKTGAESSQEKNSLLEQEVTAEQKVVITEATPENQPAAQVVVQTTQPQIEAKLPPNTMVKITVNSETAIEQTLQTDENGNVTLDIASLGQSLEPGEHSVTYNYIDPTTGQEVTKTYNFTVAGEQLALATTPTATPTPSPTSAVPYGSGNPYLPTPTPIISPPASATATPTVEATRSAVIATDSGDYNAGSVGTTFVLLMTALFFVGAGVWSFYLSGRFEREE